ncbi:hypothetical protein [Actinoplanes sp. CA-252034]|uniref:hypothetical protein n=1 Tax=Actinoplanes sp. CA-252034 TaxID=3239906 RepID=UPI003D9854C4
MRFVELGPDAVLSALVDDAVPLLRRDGDEVTTALTAVARLFVSGVAVDWTAFHDGVRPAALPTYAFQRQRYWLRSRPEAPATAADDSFWEPIDRGDLQELAARLGVAALTVEPLLPALTAWRARGRERSLIDGWRHRVIWKPADLPASPGVARPGGSGVWALIGDDDLGLADALAAAGIEAVPVIAAELAAAAVDGILVLPSVPLTDLPGLVRTADAPTWLLTRNAVATGRADGAPDVMQAAKWGLGRVAGLEHPQTWRGLIDLPRAVDAPTAGRLAAILAGALGDEDQIALRSGGALIRRLQPAPQPARIQRSPAIRPGPVTRSSPESRSRWMARPRWVVRPRWVARPGTTARLTWVARLRAAAPERACPARVSLPPVGSGGLAGPC